MADMKKPATAYFLWLSETRPKIQQEIGTKNIKDVAKKASEMWGSLSASAKQPFEAKAKEQKDAFEKFKGTEAGQQALEEKKAERAEKKDAKGKRDAKKAAKSIEKDEKLKRPTSAYFLFNGDKREEIQKMLGTKNTPAIARKCTEMWTGMTEAQKKPWTDKAKQQKEAYDAYIKTPEGAAALKEYKDEVKEAKLGVLGKRVEEPDSPEEKPAKRAKAGA